MNYYGQQYEQDYVECALCGVKRPKAALKKRSVSADSSSILACSDEMWCDNVINQRLEVADAEAKPSLEVPRETDREDAGGPKSPARVRLRAKRR